jgi:SAM-dependent methyltransferase
MRQTDKREEGACPHDASRGTRPAPAAKFDAWVENYDEALGRGLSLTGEDKLYFARGRIAWLARRLPRFGKPPRLVLDFGCGTGSTTSLFIELLGATAVIGVDSSTESIRQASLDHSAAGVRFMTLAEYQPRGEVDLAFCNGVFHHIPPGARLNALEYVSGALRSGGMFAFWENNPWNPGTRYVMSRIPFDRDAVTLTPLEARRLLRSAAFDVLRIDFLFIFPRPLRWLRRLEPILSRAPLGGQYQVLCRKR